MAASKLVYKTLVERKDLSLKVEDIVNELDLWMLDEWSHVGCCIMVCLENSKLVEGYKKGQAKLLDSLIGKTMKYANMKVDAGYIKELMPLIITTYWSE